MFILRMIPQTAPQVPFLPTQPHTSNLGCLLDFMFNIMHFVQAQVVYSVMTSLRFAPASALWLVVPRMESP